MAKRFIMNKSEMNRDDCKEREYHLVSAGVADKVGGPTADWTPKKMTDAQADGDTFETGDGIPAKVVRCKCGDPTKGYVLRVG